MAEIKPIYGLQREKLADNVPLDAPYSAFIFPTTYCNFKCIYCAHSLGHANMKEQYDFVPEHMQMATYIKTIEQLKAFPRKLKMLSLTGQGEPLLNPHIAEMVDIAKKAQVAERIEIISNGALLYKQLADDLIAAGLDVLRISLQGLSNEKYSEICGAKINFKQYVDNIAYFYKHKTNTQLYVKIMDVALEEGEDKKFYEIFDSCCDRMYIEKMLPAYDGVKLTEDLEITSDRYGNPTERKYDVCPLAFYMLGIFPNGDVEPCDTIYKPIVLGNVNNNDSTLLEMWNSEKLKDFWRMHLTGKRYDNKRCANCCAPNDVAHKEDILDNDAAQILGKLDKKD